MDYYCKKCNKTYKSRMGIYRHNKKCKPETNDENELNNKCKYCEKELFNYVSKWRHEKKCELNSKTITETVQIMREEIKSLKQQLNHTKPQTINSNNNNNNKNITNNNQNIICVFPFGKEPPNSLSMEYLIKTLTENGINSVIDIVKKKHFNPELPQLHNFCVTARNDGYASIVDPETKKIKYVNKKDVFDKVYMGVVSDVNTVNKVSGDHKETIDKINNIPVSKKILKKLHSGINEEAYHNRELVKETWSTAEFNNSGANQKEKKFIFDLNDSDTDCDYEYDNSSTNNDSKPSIINKIQELINEIESKSYLFM